MEVPVGIAHDPLIIAPDPGIAAIKRLADCLDLLRACSLSGPSSDLGLQRRTNLVNRDVVEPTKFGANPEQGLDRGRRLEGRDPQDAARTRLYEPPADERAERLADDRARNVELFGDRPFGWQPSARPEPALKDRVEDRLSDAIRQAGITRDSLEDQVTIAVRLHRGVRTTARLPRAGRAGFRQSLARDLRRRQQLVLN